MIPGSSKPELVILARFTVTPSGCWEWQGSRDRDGYGRVQRSAFGVCWFEKTHRLSYEFYVGEIPCGLHVLHRCDNPPCINPEHLYCGTHQENMRDRSKRFLVNANRRV